MPTRTVSYTEEVEKEEEIVVCSDCCREVDKNGERFEGSDSGIDFCSECLGSMWVLIQNVHREWTSGMRERMASDTLLSITSNS